MGSSVMVLTEIFVECGNLALVVWEVTKGKLLGSLRLGKVPMLRPNETKGLVLIMVADGLGHCMDLWV